MKKKVFKWVLALITITQLMGCGTNSSITASTEEECSVEKTDMTIAQEEPLLSSEMFVSLEDKTDEEEEMESKIKESEVFVSEDISEKETVVQIIPELTTEIEPLEVQENIPVVEEEKLTTTQRNSINMLNI